jgi:hypothetical protein
MAATVSYATTLLSGSPMPARDVNSEVNAAAHRAQSGSASKGAIGSTAIDKLGAATGTAAPLGCSL